MLGHEVADKLFEATDPIGEEVRLGGERFEVIGVIASKGRVLGQSFDAIALVPLSRYEMIYGHRIHDVDLGEDGRRGERRQPGCRAPRRRCGSRGSCGRGRRTTFPWRRRKRSSPSGRTSPAVLFSVIPAVVAIGVVVGGIVIMNIMLMVVTERTREIGIRKAVGARARDIERQFLAEAISLVDGGRDHRRAVAGGRSPTLVSVVSPLPARITWWSVALAVLLGAGVGVLFGVYPARRAARLDPITALRAE